MAENAHNSQMEELARALRVIHDTDMIELDELTGNGDEGVEVKRSFDSWWQWSGFCDRVSKGEATPSCVIDFPYADSGGLNLEGDDRFLERMYCFHDSNDRSPQEWLVVLHVHTFRRWGERNANGSRWIDDVTSVNVRHAHRGVSRFEQERRKFFVVPKDEELRKNWQKMQPHELVWKPHEPQSLPPRDRGRKNDYALVRKVILAGEQLCIGGVMETETPCQSEEAMRGAESFRREFEVVGLAPSGVTYGESVMLDGGQKYFDPASSASAPCPPLKFHD